MSASLAVTPPPGTPLVRLSRFAPQRVVYAKVEHLHPTGSAYDRIAGTILDQHTRERPVDKVAIVAGSGSLCLAFAAEAHRFAGELVVICPESTLPEHRILLKRHRVTVVHSEGSAGLWGTEARAAEEGRRRGGVILVSPNARDRAVRAFEGSLGAELAVQLGRIPEGEPEAIIAPVGSGALLLGIGRALGRTGHPAKLVGTLLPRGETASRQDGVVTEEQAPRLLAGEIVPVTDETAFGARVELARAEGLLVGLASAGALSVARDRSNRTPDRPQLVIVIDAGDRYFSVDRAFSGSIESGKRGSRA